jgi:hypothetical protein
MASKIQVRRGLKQDLPLLDSGEFGLAQDTEELFIGLGLENMQVAKQHWIDVSKFGYDTAALKLAISKLKDGDVLYFPNTGTPYLIEGEAITISVPNVTLTGTGLIQIEYGFRLGAGGFTADGLRLEATRHHTAARAFQCETATLPAGTLLKDFNIRNCKFKNFFYACDFRAGTYDMSGNEASEGYPIRDVVITNCRSETYKDLGRGNSIEKNAGHFQCIQVENIIYSENHTFGGRMASSYNAIKTNGYIRIANNYDEDNSYGSVEVENASGHVVIEGNTFKKKIWVDDSYNVSIDGNVLSDMIHITVGSDNGDARNISVTDNVATTIRVESFGLYKGGVIKNISIADNTLTGGVSYGIWVDGKYTEFALVDNNTILGTFSSGKMGIVRGSAWTSGAVCTIAEANADGSVKTQATIVNANDKTYMCVGAGTTGAVAPSHTSGTAVDGTVTWKYLKPATEVLLRQNINKGTVVVSGSGGKVYKDNNFGTTWNGTTDTLTYS